MDGLIREVFLAGVSSRRVGETLEAVLGEGVSAQTVSRVVRSLNREVRRRTRPMTCFTNEASCERIIYAVVSHLNTNWQGRPLQQFTQNS